MTINTKFNLGETVYVVIDGKVKTMYITDIMIFLDEKYHKEPNIIYKGKYMTEYNFTKIFDVKEEMAYKSKEDLINSL